MGQIDAGPGGEELIVAGIMGLKPPGGDGLQVNGAGGADKGAGPAGLALIRLFRPGRSHLLGGAAAEEVDRAAPHHLVADPGAESAEDAFPFGRRLKRGGVNAEVRSEFGQLSRVRGLGQEQFENRLARVPDGRGFGMDHQAVFGRVAAGGDQLASRPVSISTRQTRQAP